jgi:hypothetical protein
VYGRLGLPVERADLLETGREDEVVQRNHADALLTCKVAKPSPLRCRRDDEAVAAGCAGNRVRRSRGCSPDYGKRDGCK